MTAPNEPTLDAGHLYRPRFWPHAQPWKPKAGQCRCAVPDEGRWPTYHQCNRKAKVTRTVKLHGEIVEVEYCGQHDPVAVAEKDAARKAKYDAQWAAREAKWARQRAGEAALDIVRQVAKGHNDPRTICLDFLTKHGLPIEEPQDA